MNTRSKNNCIRVLNLSIHASLLFLLSFSANAKTIETNEANVRNAPEWLDQRTVEKIGARVTEFLEWTIKKVNVNWIHGQTEFENAHGLGPTVVAFTKKKQNSITLGPRVDQKRFEQTFAHELTHIVIFQKYKEAIPRWLEEGLANFIAKKKSPDYTWLSKQTRPNMRSLSHPFKGTAQPHLHYTLSTAAMEMIASKCDVHDLLQMSLGKSIDTYLDRLCGIENLDRSLNSWIAMKTQMQKMMKKIQ